MRWGVCIRVHQPASIVRARGSPGVRVDHLLCVSPTDGASHDLYWLWKSKVTPRDSSLRADQPLLLYWPQQEAESHQHPCAPRGVNSRLVSDSERRPCVTLSSSAPPSYPNTELRQATHRQAERNRKCDNIPRDTTQTTEIHFPIWHRSLSLPTTCWISIRLSRLTLESRHKNIFNNSTCVYFESNTRKCRTSPRRARLWSSLSGSLPSGWLGVTQGRQTKKKTGAWGEGQGERRWCKKDRSFHLTGSSPMLDLPARTQDRRDAQTLAFLWEIIIRHHHLILWGGSLLDTLPGRLVIMTLAPDQGSLWFACLWGKCVYKSDLKVKVVDFIWVSRVQPWFSHLKSRGCVMVC